MEPCNSFELQPGFIQEEEEEEEEEEH